MYFCSETLIANCINNSKLTTYCTFCSTVKTKKNNTPGPNEIARNMFHLSFGRENRLMNFEQFIVGRFSLFIMPTHGTPRRCLQCRTGCIPDCLHSFSTTCRINQYYWIDAFLFELETSNVFQFRSSIWNSILFFFHVWWINFTALTYLLLFLLSAICGDGQHSFHHVAWL